MDILSSRPGDFGRSAANQRTMWNRIARFFGWQNPPPQTRPHQVDDAGTQFVRFSVDDCVNFAALQQVFGEIKALKNLDFEPPNESKDMNSEMPDYDVDGLRAMMPDAVRSRFVWPVADEIDAHKVDRTVPMAISRPGAFLGCEWSLVRILDLIDDCEYSLDRCEMVDEKLGELHVLTHAYPYGGLNALIALIEGFGFEIVGVNECGKYESIEDLKRDRRS